MLPSKLFRNTGLPPTLRSLIIPHASLPSTVAVQLRFRLGIMPMSMAAPNTRSALGMRAAFSNSSIRTNDTPKVTPSPVLSEGQSTISSNVSSEPTTTSQALPEKMVPKLQITFTCTVHECGERSTHQFTKQAYEQGVVLIQCPKCKNRYYLFPTAVFNKYLTGPSHLIADHLGWFADGTENGKLPRIEDILRQKGEAVRRGVVTEGGDISYTQ